VRGLRAGGLALVCVALLSLVAGEARADSVIVALGDSLTAGLGVAPDETYPARLEQRLRREGYSYRVINAGVSGDTTAGGLRRVDWVLRSEPEIVIVALGANDGLRGVPVAQLRRNLETIIEAAQERNSRVLLCGMEALPVRGWEYTLEFHRLYPALAQKYDVPLVPFLLNGVIGNPGMVQDDRVHPNAAGAAEIARTIWPFLEPLAMKIAGAVRSI
jgi:acyl-CoA thioesterase I